MSSERDELAASGGDDGMDCENAQRQIERLAIDNDLRDVERHLLQLHLRTCVACRKVFENVRKLENEMKQSMAALDTAPRFTERVMAVLPAGAPGVSTTHKQRVPVNRESSVFVTGSYVRSAPSAPATESRPFLRRYTGVWLAVALSLTLMAVLGFYASYTRIRGENAPPCVATVNGRALRVLPSNEQERVLNGDYIGSKEVLISGEKPVELRLESEKKFIARLVLAPRSRLRAMNRHTYHLLQGAAYFQVAKDRPGHEEEVFVVEATMRARVEVTGTAFCVDLQNATANGALIVVEEGTVRVSAGSIRQVAVQAGEEIDVAASDSGPRPTNLVARMEWMRPSAAVAVSPTAPAVETQAVKPEPTPTPSTAQNVVPVAPPIDWNAIVADLPVAGQSFNNAWENLTQRVGPSQSLRNVQAQFTPHMDGDAMRVRFSAHAPLSLKNFVSWLARDVGCRFEIRENGTVSVRRAVAGELPGMSTEGMLPPDMKSRLRTPPEDAVALRDAGSLDEFMDRLGRRARLTIVANDPALINAFAVAPAVERNPLKYKTAGDWLSYAEKVCGARAIWYDGVIYFAPLDTVEELTSVQRTAEIEPAVAGVTLKPEIARALRDIAGNLRYESPAQAGARRAGNVALADVAVAPTEGPRGGLLLRYTTGIAGDEILRDTLAQLKAGAPRANDPTRLFSQPMPPGTIRDLDELLEMSRKKLVAAESRVKLVPFTRQAFVAKNLDFGEALEWAAWLGGAGLRQENGMVIVDELSRCYGPAKLQVLVLEGVPEALRPAAAARVAALCPELYPSFFKDVRFYPLHGRIAFSGDLRQLLLAQRIGAALEDGFARGDVASVETWMPPTRTKLITRLRDKVQSSGKLAGTFAGVLRQGSLASQLPGTVLVDPQAMKDAAALPVDVPATTLMDVLQQLAKQARLTMTLEGDVVWFHP